MIHIPRSIDTSRVRERLTAAFGAPAPSPDMWRIGTYGFLELREREGVPVACFPERYKDPCGTPCVFTEIRSMRSLEMLIGHCVRCSY